MNILTDGIMDVHIRPSLIISDDIISFRGDGFIMLVAVPIVVFCLKHIIKLNIGIWNDLKLFLI